MTTTAADPIEEVLVDLVGAVLELIDTPHSDPRYAEMELAVLDLCIAASTERPEPAELGVRIAELRAHGTESVKSPGNSASPLGRFPGDCENRGKP